VTLHRRRHNYPFVGTPSGYLRSGEHLIDSGSRDTLPLTGMFTLTQAEVAQALGGKANKIIAYELNLRESTVRSIFGIS